MEGRDRNESGGWRRKTNVRGEVERSGDGTAGGREGECVVQDRGRGVIIIHIQHSLSGSECSPLVWRRSLTSGLTCRRRVASGHVNEHLDFSERERCFVSGFFGE